MVTRISISVKPVGLTVGVVERLVTFMDLKGATPAVSAIGGVWDAGNVTETAAFFK
jgi:hypothetical protein